MYKNKYWDRELHRRDWYNQPDIKRAQWETVRLLQASLKEDCYCSKEDPPFQQACVRTVHTVCKILTMFIVILSLTFTAGYMILYIDDPWIGWSLYIGCVIFCTLAYFKPQGENLSPYCSRSFNHGEGID